MDGPLFWAHYSYIGLDPRGLSDKYVKNYFDLNKNHVLIDYKYVWKILKIGKVLAKTTGTPCWLLPENKDGSVRVYMPINLPKNDHEV